MLVNVRLVTTKGKDLVADSDGGRGESGGKGGGWGDGSGGSGAMVGRQWGRADDAKDAAGIGEGIVLDVQ